MNTQPRDAILVNDVHKSYGAKEVLRGITFAVKRGEVFGLLGPNGAGKTTTLETIVGLRTPTSGTVSVCGLNPTANRREVTQRLAVQPQAATLFPTLTVSETIALFASFYRTHRGPAELLREIELEDASGVRVKHLSGGQERRLLIGIALAGNPEVLVLDEPSAGLDPSARHNLWSIIARQRERGTSILLSTHHMDEAAHVCDRIAIVVDGHIAATGEPDALIREHAATATVSFSATNATSPSELMALGIPGDITITDAGTRGTTHTPTATQFRIVTDDPDLVLRRLTFAPELGAHGFSVKHGSLEDLFLDLATGAHLPTATRPGTTLSAATGPAATGHGVTGATEPGHTP